MEPFHFSFKPLHTLILFHFVHTARGVVGLLVLSWILPWNLQSLKAICCYTQYFAGVVIIELKLFFNGQLLRLARRKFKAFSFRIIFCYIKFSHRNFREKRKALLCFQECFLHSIFCKKTFCRYKKIITIHLFHTAPSKNVYSLDDRSFQIYLVCNKRFTRSPGMIFLYLTCTVGSPPLWQREFLYRC